MRNVHVVQMFDGFNSGAGWVPVCVCNSDKEAQAYINDQKKLGIKNDWRGLHYRTKSCKYIAR